MIIYCNNIIAIRRHILGASFLLFLSNKLLLVIDVSMISKTLDYPF